MVGFRNIAVHDYQTLNLDILKQIVENHLGDFTSFTKQILKKQYPRTEGESCMNWLRVSARSVLFLMVWEKEGRSHSNRSCFFGDALNFL